jgi:hypothetical protein
MSSDLIHYNVVLEKPKAECGSWSEKVTCVPRKVTCAKCKATRAYREMMSG